MAPRVGAPSTQLTAARLSSLSTSTLSKILELVRLQQQGDSTFPASITNGITKNLNTLRAGIEALVQEQAGLDGPGTRKAVKQLMSEEEQKNRREITNSLRKQYQRLAGLCEGLGMDVPGLSDEEAGPSTGATATAAKSPSPVLRSEDHEHHHPLIDSRTSVDVPMETLGNGRSTSPNARSPVQQQQPHVAIDLHDDDDGDAETFERRASSAIDTSERYRDDPEDARMDEEEMRRANQDVMLMQRQMIDDQDHTLEQLSAAIQRQRDLSLTISSELELHENLIDETDEALDRTGNRLRRASRSLDTVAKRARDNRSACMLVTLIIVLTILVIVIKL